MSSVSTILWTIAISRSADYGRSFENIEAQLNPEKPDPEPDPLLWRSFYVSPGNLNMVSCEIQIMGEHFLF